MTTKNVRSELNKVATQLETLAHEVRVKLAAKNDVFDVANELVKSTVMLTFGLGQLYGAEQMLTTLAGSNTNVSTTTGGAPRPRNVSANWQRPRENNGRFARVVRP